MAKEELCPQIHEDEGYAYAVRWCRKLKTIKPGMLDELPQGFVPPKQPIKSRKHTPKIMVTAVLSRPEKKAGVGFYGGKVALLRCSVEVVAKNASKNHKRGEIYQRDTSMNSKMFKDQLTTKIFPKIKSDISLKRKAERFANQLRSSNETSNFPENCKWADLFLQCDNAPPHCKKSKRLFPMIKKAGGRNILRGVYYGPKVRVTFQPPDSPDLNVLDLGFFNSLWTKTHKILAMLDRIPSLDNVWEAVNVAWNDITPVDIEVLFRTLHLRMKQVIECEGRNDMSIPHVGIRERVQLEDIELKKSELSS